MERGVFRRKKNYEDGIHTENFIEMKTEMAYVTREKHYSPLNSLESLIPISPTILNLQISPTSLK